MSRIGYAAALVLCLAGLGVLIESLGSRQDHHTAHPKARTLKKAHAAPAHTSLTTPLITLRDLPHPASIGQTSSVAFKCPGYAEFHKLANPNLETPLFYIPSGIVRETLARFHSKHEAQQFISRLGSSKTQHCVVRQTLPLIPLAIGVRPIGPPVFKTMHPPGLSASIRTNRIEIPVADQSHKTTLYLDRILAREGTSLYSLSFIAVGKPVPTHTRIELIRRAIERGEA